MKLTVKSLKQKDAGRGLAAVHPSLMDALGVEKGDYVMVTSDTDCQTVARVFPGYSEDKGKQVIRIDGQHRQEVEAGIDDRVHVEKADVENAREITVALPTDLRIEGNLKPHLLDELSGKAASSGQAIPISLGFGHLGGGGKNKFSVVVVDTDPEGPVIITDATRLQISEDPAENYLRNRSTRQTGADQSAQSPTVTRTVDVDNPIDPTAITYEDIGGLEAELAKIREMVELPMRHPELFQQLGIDPPKGVLMHGPPGTGKTMIAKAVANEINAHFTNISGPEIMAAKYGESEEQLRDIFDTATENAPAIIFFDEIDAIAPDREDDNSGSTERRIVTQLLSLMDGLDDRGDVVIIAATNRVDSIDNALRRGGRFDREIEIGVPDKEGREEILQVHTRDMPLRDGIDISAYAERTHGFVGADLEMIAKEAAMHALRRVRPDIDLESDRISASLLESLEVTEDDMKAALTEVEPSAMREVFVEVPDVEWEDVGGLDETKHLLQKSVEWPLEYSDVFDHMNLDASNGVLMYGPPGTGKTLLAKAVANETASNFISIKGPEIMSKWVGESEERIREVFEEARANAPAIIFFDEIDAIASERDTNSSNDIGERVVAQLLTELDGMETLDDVVVIAATNRPDMIDDALLRPGRFDSRVHVPVPDEAAREQIFEVHLADVPTTTDIDTAELAAATEGYVGADIKAICDEAAMQKTEEFIEQVDRSEMTEALKNLHVSMDDVKQAIENTSPSVDRDTRTKYHQFEEKFRDASIDIEYE